jgi:hypothetical protein
VHELGGDGCGGDGSAAALPVSWRRKAMEWREWRAAAACWQLKPASALTSGDGAEAWRPRGAPALRAVSHDSH